MKAAMLVRTGSSDKIAVSAGGQFIRRSPSRKMPSRSSLNFGAKEVQIELKLLRRARSDTDLVALAPSCRIEGRYEELLRADPGNPLLLRNYGQFLHKVEGNLKGAEECYGRAILASPRDGDVLSLYGKLVWEAYGDGERAANYFERAVEASPEDCYVLASYAKFLWDVEKDEEDEGNVAAPSSLVEAF